MHLSKLPSGNWIATVKVNGQRKAVTRPTKNEARQAGAELEYRLGATPGATGSVTVEELLDTWFARAELSVTYRADATSAINKHLPPVFAARTLRKVTPAVVEALHAEMTAKGASPGRVLRVHTVLSSAWAMALRYGWAASNPFVVAKKPAIPKAQVRPPTVDELTRLYAVCPPKLLLYMELAEQIGARRGELVGLQWADVGPTSIYIGRARAAAGGEVVTVDGKSGRKGWRVVAIDTELAGALHALRIEQVQLALAAPGLPAPVWVWSHDAGVTPWLPEYPTKQFAKVRKAANVDTDVKLHGMRHSMASELLAAGIPTKVVADRVGHTREATTTDIYGHLVPAADQAAAEIIANVRRRRKSAG